MIKIKPELLLQIFDAVRGRFTLTEIENLPLSELVGLVELYTTEQLQADLIPVIESVILENGAPGKVIALLPKGAITGPYAFSIAEPGTARYISQYVAEHVAEISQNTAVAIQQTVQRNEAASINPRTTAREVKANIGLTAKQEQAVANYKSFLENGDRQALQRQLRDKRFDSTVNNAIVNDTRLTTKQIDTMTERYRQKYLKYRSEVIARTEQLTAVTVGQHQSILQAQAEGKVSPRLRRDWVYTHDGKARHWHRNVSALNPGGVKVDEKYLTQPPGRNEYLDHPRDPVNGSASNIIQCRCREKYKMVSE